MEDAEIIGYWVQSDEREEPICLDCWETEWSRLERTGTICWCDACAKDEPPLCAWCGLYLPTRGEP